MSKEVCESRLTHAGTPEHAFGKPVQFTSAKGGGTTKTMVKCSWCGYSKMIDVRKSGQKSKIRRL